MAHRPSTSPTKSSIKKAPTKKVRRRKSTAGPVRRGSLSLDKASRVHTSNIDLNVSLKTDPSPSSLKIETESSLTGLNIDKIESSKTDDPNFSRGITMNTGDLTLNTGGDLTISTGGGLTLNTAGLTLNTNANIKSKESKFAVLVPPRADSLSENEYAEHRSPNVATASPVKRHLLRVSVSAPDCEAGDSRSDEGISSPVARPKLRTRRQSSTFPAPARR